MNKTHAFNSLEQLKIGTKTYSYYSLAKAEQNGLKNIHRLPFSLKILLENLLRHEDGRIVKHEDLQAFTQWLEKGTSTHEIAYHPARVLMQDFTGVPAVVDLAAMRDAMVVMGGDPKKINPRCCVDLIIDHSVQVDAWQDKEAYKKNVDLEMERNFERYAFLKWGQKSFNNFRVVPPGTGICHQVNLEYLAQCVWTETKDGQCFAYPDTLVGTDSHTTMINGLGVLGWGVGGIEAEAAMLGQPISMLIPDVVGFKMTGHLREGVTATDLVLTVTQILRTRGVVDQFVEYFGPGIAELSLADRATLANMAPEYGATCGLFPIDEETLRYLELTGRDPATIQLVKEYAKAQYMWHSESTPDPIFSDVIELDLSAVEPCLAGPKRPQDRVTLQNVPQAMHDELKKQQITPPAATATLLANPAHALQQGDVVIAAITSCTNTSNPAVMLAAGLVAKKALARGLKAKPWVKCSIAPGSKVVTDYLHKTQLMTALEKIGFFLVGFGCTTCIGNSGPLADDISDAINKNSLNVSAVLSGNRNFEGRIHAQVKANWLGSPPLVVAYALAGTTLIDLTRDPLSIDAEGQPVYLKDLWPTRAEIDDAIQVVTQQMFRREYAEVFTGDETWQQIPIAARETYAWDPESTYVKLPPFFAKMTKQPAPLQDVHRARILAILGDSITTDHISPAGSIKASSPAGHYLQAHGVTANDFNSYGARRGNFEAMVRGTFANIRIRNEMVPGKEGGVTQHYPDGAELSIYDAAMKYQQEKIPLVILAGKEYGTGSSRDWAAKGTLLLGVKAVIAESFERIHRSNLIGMGILPLEFKNDMNRLKLQLRGDEFVDIQGVEGNHLRPQSDLQVLITHPDGSQKTVSVRCRIDTENELSYYKHGGILQYVLRGL